MTYYEFARNYNFHYRKPPKIRPNIWKNSEKFTNQTYLSRYFWFKISFFRRIRLSSLVRTCKTTPKPFSELKYSRYWRTCSATMCDFKQKMMVKPRWRPEGIFFRENESGDYILNFPQDPKTVFRIEISSFLTKIKHFFSRIFSSLCGLRLAPTLQKHSFENRAVVPSVFNIFRFWKKFWNLELNRIYTPRALFDLSTF